MMTKEQTFLRVKDVMQVADCSQSMAYQIIRQLNNELKAQGYLTIAGRINRKYFLQRFGDAENEA